MNLSLRDQNINLKKKKNDPSKIRNILKSNIQY